MLMSALWGIIMAVYVDTRRSRDKSVQLWVMEAGTCSYIKECWKSGKIVGMKKMRIDDILFGKRSLACENANMNLADS